MMSLKSPQRIKTFQRKILAYYKEKGRDLPWRKTTDSYHILLSEIMLQQTQVDRVVEYYHRWTKKWPTVFHLARARRSTVLQEWMGLGYNNRALNLHKAAKKIATDYNGDVIAAMKNYQHVPGVGPYTSKAVQIFSQNASEVTVDTNIRRIFIHEFRIPESTSDKELWALAEQCLPKRKSRDWHNALMDYGATLLTSRSTGIKPKTQQSTFEGSDRQIRAKILRHFLREKSGLKVKGMKKVVGKVAISRLESILHKMIKDDLLRLENKTYFLST